MFIFYMIIIQISSIKFREFLTLRYIVYRCWVSEFQALPELDANGNAIAIESITLENEGWERDYDVPEPAESSFSEPD